MTVATPRAEADLQSDLILLERAFPEQAVMTRQGPMSYRACGGGPVVVLLHGISSAAASWLQCALKLAGQARVIAWNAPGYGASAALPPTAARVEDYAASLDAMLDSLEVEPALVVGHSLGALVACAYAQRVDTVPLVLISPAAGYGNPAQRSLAQAVAGERLGRLATLGVAGMAEQRHAHMLAPQAGASALAWVRWNMQQLSAPGYSQAVAMLCGADIYQSAPGRVQHVYGGAADTITPPASCRRVAAHFAVAFTVLEQAGHACYIEQPDRLARLIGHHL